MLDRQGNRAVVVETWGGIGDCLLTTPALKALKESQPTREIWIFCMDNHLQILANNPYTDYFSSVTEDPHFQDTEILETNCGRLTPSLK